MFAKLKREKRMDLLSSLFIFSPTEKEQEVHKCIDPKHFRVSGIKISDGVTKETIAADTVAFSETANKFSQSLRGLIDRCRI